MTAPPPTTSLASQLVSPRADCVPEGTRTTTRKAVPSPILTSDASKTSTYAIDMVSTKESPHRGERILPETPKDTTRFGTDGDAAAGGRRNLKSSQGERRNPMSGGAYSAFASGSRTYTGSELLRPAEPKSRSPGQHRPRQLSTSPIASSNSQPLTPRSRSTLPYSTSGSGASQFLLTVVPPSHLPHDPPHPRTSNLCSGYGPPDKFKRGTLVPLYPTLASQLAAIAREYGLPSTGGIALYLLSTSDPMSSNTTSSPLPGSHTFTGEDGPRIGEEAWNILWRRLFETEDDGMVLLSDSEGFSDDEEYDQARAAPPVPSIPSSHFDSHFHGGPEPAKPTLPVESGEFELEKRDFSSESESRHSEAEQIARASVYPNNTALHSSPSRNGDSASYTRNIHNKSTSVQLNSQGKPRRTSTFSKASPHSGSHSIKSPSPGPLNGQGYGASIIVGKVEFDIDWRRGGRSRWYEGFVQGAEPLGTSSSAVPSPYETSYGVRKPPTVVSEERGPLELPLSGSAQHSTLAEGSKPQELFLPNLVRERQSSGYAKSTDLNASARSVPQMRIRTASGMSGKVESVIHSAPPSGTRENLGLGIQDLSDLTDLPGAEAEQERDISRPPSSSSVHSSEALDHFPQKDTYATLDDDADHSGMELTESDSDTNTHSESRPSASKADDEEALLESPIAGPRGSLSDMFPNDSSTWQSIADEPRPEEELNEMAMVETTGLGIQGLKVEELTKSRSAGVVEQAVGRETNDEAGRPPPQDDVADVMALIAQHPSTTALPSSLAAPTPPEPSTSKNTHTRSSIASSLSDSQSQSRLNVESPVGSRVSTPSPPDGHLASNLNRQGRQGWVPPYLRTSESVSEEKVVDDDVEEERNEVGDLPTNISAFETDSIHDSQRSSTIGLMENLDDLEKALEELSPRVSRKAGEGNKLRTYRDTAAPFHQIRPRPALPPTPSYTLEPSSTSPRLAARPVFVYPSSSRRSGAPLRDLRLLANAPGYEANSEEERNAPRSPGAQTAPNSETLLDQGGRSQPEPSMQQENIDVLPQPRSPNLQNFVGTPSIWNPSSPPNKSPGSESFKNSGDVSPIPQEFRIFRKLPRIPTKPSQEDEPSGPPLVPTPPRSPALGAFKKQSRKLAKSASVSEDGEAREKASFFGKKLNGLFKRGEFSPEPPASPPAVASRLIDTTLDSPPPHDGDFDQFHQTSPRHIFPVIASGQTSQSPRSPNLGTFSQSPRSDRFMEQTGSAAESRLSDPPQGSYVRRGSRQESSEPTAPPLMLASSNNGPITSPRSDHIHPFPSTSSTISSALLDSATDSGPSNPAFEKVSGEMQEFTSSSSSRFGRKFRLSQDLDLENLLSQMKDIDSESADEDLGNSQGVKGEVLAEQL